MRKQSEVACALDPMQAQPKCCGSTLTLISGSTALIEPNPHIFTLPLFRTQLDHEQQQGETQAEISVAASAAARVGKESYRACPYPSISWPYGGDNLKKGYAGRGPAHYPPQYWPQGQSQSQSATRGGQGDRDSGNRTGCEEHSAGAGGGGGHKQHTHHVHIHTHGHTHRHTHLHHFNYEGPAPPGAGDGTCARDRLSRTLHAPAGWEQWLAFGSRTLGCTQGSF